MGVAHLPWFHDVFVISLFQQESKRIRHAYTYRSLFLIPLKYSYYYDDFVIKKPKNVQSFFGCLYFGNNAYCVSFPYSDIVVSSWVMLIDQRRKTQRVYLTKVAFPLEKNPSSFCVTSCKQEGERKEQLCLMNTMHIMRKLTKVASSPGTRDGP